MPRGLSLTKLPGLKAEPNLANGGIGVSFSNVVLGGGINHGDPQNLAAPKSSYQNHFDDLKQRRSIHASPLNYD